MKPTVWSTWFATGWQRRFLLGWLILTLVSLPLIVVPSGYDPYRFPKWLVLRLSALVVMMHFTISWEYWRVPTSRALLGSRLRRWMTAGISATLLWVLASVVLSPSLDVSLWRFGDLLALTVIYLATRVCGEQVSTRPLFFVVLVPATVISVIVVLQTLDLWHPLLPAGGEDSLAPQEAGLLRKAALLGNRNDVGMYLSLCAVANLCVVRFVRRSRRISISTLSLVGVAVLLTGTVTSIAAAAAVSALIVFLNESGNRPSLRGALGASLALLIVIAVPLIVDPSLRNRLSYRWDSVVSGSLDQATGGRMGAFGAAVLMTADHPWVGVGPGRFAVEYVPYATRLRQAGDLISSRDVSDFDMTHNDYLQFSAESGLPVLVLGLSAIGLLIIEVRSRRDPGPPLEWSLTLAIILVTSLTALTLFPLQVGAIAGTTMILLGAASGGSSWRS